MQPAAHPGQERETNQVSVVLAAVGECSLEFGVWILESGSVAQQAAKFRFDAPFCFRAKPYLVERDSIRVSP